MDRPTHTVAFLAGGKGTRLKTITGTDQQKVLVRVAGRPLLQYSIGLFNDVPVNEMVFCLDHLSQQVATWLNTQPITCNVRIITEDQPGVLDNIIRVFNETNAKEVIVCNGDEIRLGLDVAAAHVFHKQHSSVATVVATQSMNLARHRVLVVKNDQLLSSTLHNTAFLDNPHAVGLVNTGLWILRRGCLNALDSRPGSNWSNLIDPLCNAGLIHVHVQPNIRYVNVGSPEEYHEACALFRPS